MRESEPATAPRQPVAEPHSATELQPAAETQPVPEVPSGTVPLETGPLETGPSGDVAPDIPEEGAAECSATAANADTVPKDIETRPEDLWDLWGILQEALTRRVQPEQFETWFRRASLVGVNGRTVILAVQNNFAREWLQNYYLETIESAVHAVLGVKIWLEGTPTASQYRYGGNVRYTLQRVTGVVGFAFILIHLWHMHWLGKPFGGGHFDPHRAAETASAAMQSGFWYAPIYVIGVVCVVFHLANGIWTSLITWGITVGPQAQRKAGWACAVFGVMVGLAGLTAVRGFRTFDVPSATGVTVEQVEDSGH